MSDQDRISPFFVFTLYPFYRNLSRTYTFCCLKTGKRASVLAAKGTVDIILRVIVSASKEASVCEEALLLCHVILTKVGPKGEMSDICKLIPGDLFGYM